MLKEDYFLLFFMATRSGSVLPMCNADPDPEHCTTEIKIFHHKKVENLTPDWAINKLFCFFVVSLESERAKWAC